MFRYHATCSVGDIKLLGWNMLGSAAYLFAGQDRFGVCLWMETAGLVNWCAV